MSAWDRFWAKVEVGDCWVWTASSANGGYGQFFPGDGKRWRAHRWLWTQLVGEIAPGLEADHMCRNPPCVNPDHIQLVTKKENLAARPSVKAAREATHCQRGHEFTPENTRRYWPPTRRCRECDNARARARYHRETKEQGR